MKIPSRPVIGDKMIYRCKCGSRYQGIFKATSPEVFRQTGVNQMCCLVNEKGEDVLALPCGHTNQDLKPVILMRGSWLVASKR